MMIKDGEISIVVVVVVVIRLYNLNELSFSYLIFCDFRSCYWYTFLYFIRCMNSVFFGEECCNTEEIIKCAVEGGKYRVVEREASAILDLILAQPFHESIYKYRDE